MNLLEDFNIFRTQNGSFLCFEQLAVFLLLTWVECCVVLRLRQCFPVQQLTGPLGRLGGLRVWDWVTVWACK